MANQNLGQLRVNDPVLTQVVHGYAQADSIAPFIAPVITVPVRAGKIVKFTKEQFLLTDTRRSPGSTVQRLSTNYTNEGYFLQQHAAGGETTIEAYEEALNGEAAIDLRVAAANRAAQAVAQSWENEIASVVTDAAKYETSTTATVSGTDMFDNASSDPEKLVQGWKEAIRAQVGVYPNSAVIDPKTFNALKYHPIYRDRIKYTSSGSINLDMLAQWLDLPRGIRVAQRVVYNPATGLMEDIWPKGNMLLFFNPEGGLGTGFMPIEGANKAVPAAFYTYQLKGYPMAEPERFDSDRKVFVVDVIAEQSIQEVGLGATGKVGAAFLAKGLVA